MTVLKTPLRRCGAAIPDLDRREMIRMAGYDSQAALWVGTFGWYMGSLRAPYLGIPPTGRLVAMRYHEFFRVEGDRVTEIQALWDIPELMMQANAWPMVPSLGREFHAPAPASQDGLSISGDGAEAMQIVADMLAGLTRNREGVAAMQLDKFWHPKMTWYGPAGIGTSRGIEGFRHHHQAPFLSAMPDRRARLDAGHAFSEGNYVGFTAWPGMEMTVSGAGWLGLPPTGQESPCAALILARRKWSDRRELGAGRSAGCLSPAWRRCVGAHGRDPSLGRQAP